MSRRMVAIYRPLPNHEPPLRRRMVAIHRTLPLRGSQVRSARGPAAFRPLDFELTGVPQLERATQILLASIHTPSVRP